MKEIGLSIAYWKMKRKRYELSLIVKHNVQMISSYYCDAIPSFSLCPTNLQRPKEAFLFFNNPSHPSLSLSPSPSHGYKSSTWLAGSQLICVDRGQVVKTKERSWSYGQVKFYSGRCNQNIASWFPLPAHWWRACIPVLKMQGFLMPIACFSHSWDQRLQVWSMGIIAGLVKNIIILIIVFLFLVLII